MEEQMKKIVDMLKERIKYNLQLIKKNEEDIGRILSQPLSRERSILLKENYNANRMLIEENNDLLTIEIHFNNYLDKFREVIKHQNTNIQPTSETNNENYHFESENFHNNSKSEQLIENDGINLLYLTLSGDIPFNLNHPKFYDEKFIEVLFDRYKQTENYEMCSYLLKLKVKK